MEVPPRLESAWRHFTNRWGASRWRTSVEQWQANFIVGAVVLLGGTLLATLLVALIDRYVPLTNPGLVYLPLVAMLAYYWGWRLATFAFILQLACVYLFFLAPRDQLKLLSPQETIQLVTLAAVTGFVLALVQLARHRRAGAEQAARRFAALNRVGTALASELDESRLLHLIAETARDLTAAEFAAFTLRPLNERGQPVVPSEGNLFHLAAVVGVTAEQEALFRRMPLGGEGLLAPIFRYGVPVRVADALAHVAHPESIHGAQARAMSREARQAAQQAAFDYAHGHLSHEGLHSMGVPRGHPIIRSFLGTPLLDREGQVRGGLLLGHSRPGRFTPEDEALLVGLSAEAAVAVENARLYREARAQAQELDAIFESIVDGISLVDDQGHTLRENNSARQMRAMRDAHAQDVQPLLDEPARRALKGEIVQSMSMRLQDDQQETREYLVSASLLRETQLASGPLVQVGQPGDQRSEPVTGAVVVWHDVTESRRLQRERQAHVETEARRVLLQAVIDELPSSVYLVHGKDARLVLANRAAATVWGASWPQGQPMSEFLTSNGIRVFHLDGRQFAPHEFATFQAVQNGATIRHHQEIIRHPDGTTLPVLVNAVPIVPHVLGWSRNGQETRAGELEPAALVVHQDVTALKEAERLKDEFIGIAAHELRNPLAVMKGFAQMLLLQTARGKGPQLAEWQFEAIQDIDQATSRLVELTEDLLDVTRLQAGRLDLQLEPTDLVALTKRVVSRLSLSTERHTLTLDTHAAHLVVFVDHRRIEQVLTNILTNAIKYSPNGGEITITLSADQTSNNVLISVGDSGIGIPKEQQARIFGRFVRGDNAKALEIGGTGLGLYLSRELVECHHGRIWFESTEGRGSTFYISLPLFKEEQIETTSAIEESAQALPAS
jgi:two-component system phosphate regulon sensor histidine kinase PhoR